jgi:phosphohistidine phosphatase
MKSLVVVRHAKSSWRHPELNDSERSLNKRGKRDAPVMGKRLARRGVRPDVIISSPAKRALTTARIIAAEIGHDEEAIVVDERIYDASAGELRDVICTLDNSYSQVMIVGHNPAFTDLVNQLSTEWVDNLPTCGVVELTFDIGGWEELAGPVTGRTSFDYPKSSE